MRITVKAYRDRLGFFARLRWWECQGHPTHGPPEYTLEQDFTGYHATRAGLVHDIRQRVREIRAWDRKIREEWASPG